MRMIKVKDDYDNDDIGEKELAANKQLYINKNKAERMQELNGPAHIN